MIFHWKTRNRYGLENRYLKLLESVALGWGLEDQKDRWWRSIHGNGKAWLYGIDVGVSTSNAV